MAWEAWTWTRNSSPGETLVAASSGCRAAEAGGLCVGFVGAKGDEVEAEDVGERGLKLVDLGIEFEEEAGL